MSAAIVASVGLCCPLGMNFESASGAYSSGQLALQMGTAFVGPGGLPPTLAYVLAPEEERSYARRLRFLLDHAYADCVERGSSIKRGSSYPLTMFLVLPAWMENTRHLQNFTQTFDARPMPHVGKINLSYSDQSGGLAALSIAANSVAGGEADAMLVAALDSYIDFTLIDRLAVENLLLVRKQQPYGFIPGEACAMVLIASQQLQPMPYVEICCIGSGLEPMDPSQGTRGRGLAEALWQIRSVVPHVSPIRVLADLNGERWRAEQYGFAVANAGITLGDAVRNPECHCIAMGDLGAATGLVMLALATGPPPRDFRKRNPSQPGFPALIVCSGGTGRSCALMLTMNG
jgi:hypothetical protein